MLPEHTPSLGFDRTDSSDPMDMSGQSPLRVSAHGNAGFYLTRLPDHKVIPP